LWIDMTSFVVMARDRRSYRFLKDTRLGRTVILETAKLDDMADTVTHYVAERIIERERAIEGDWLIKRVMRDEAGRRENARAEEDRRADARLAEARGAVEVVRAEPMAARGIDAGNLGWIVAAFLGGIVVAAAVLFGYAWIAVG
jgi:hypothetical protein